MNNTLQSSRDDDRTPKNSSIPKESKAFSLFKKALAANIRKRVTVADQNTNEFVFMPKVERSSPETKKNKTNADPVESFSPAIPVASSVDF